MLMDHDEEDDPAVYRSGSSKKTDTNGKNGTNGTNDANGSNGTNGASPAIRRKNPYQSNPGEFLSNVGRFKIIESTLRGLSLPNSLNLSLLVLTAHLEGEQFANAYFDTQTKINMYALFYPIYPLPY